MVKIPNKAIDDLDLDLIIAQFTDPDLYNWSSEIALKIANQYKIFLYLKQKYPDKNIIPFREVDEFWHWHILHTRKYEEDCRKIFGRYIHHAPHKQRTEEDREFYRKHFLMTVELVRKEFPEIV